MPSYLTEKKALSSAQTAVRACNEVIKNMDILFGIARQRTNGQLDISGFDSIPVLERSNCEHFDSGSFGEMLDEVISIENDNRMNKIKQISNLK